MRRGIRISNFKLLPNTRQTKWLVEAMLAVVNGIETDAVLLVDPLFLKDDLVIDKDGNWVGSIGEHLHRPKGRPFRWTIHSHERATRRPPHEGYEPTLADAKRAFREAWDRKIAVVK